MKKLFFGGLLAAALLTGAVEIPMVSDVKSAHAWINLNTYKQSDSRWGSDIMAGSITIASEGCVITSIANGLSGNALGFPSTGEIITPKNLNSWLKANGGYNSSAALYWDKIVQINPNRITFNGRYYNHADLSNSTLKSYLDAGNKLILANVANGAHWVALSTHNTVDSYVVSDPATPGRSSYNYSEFVGYAVYTLAP
ncbi:MAG: hypothetical protein WCC10_16920 [Tumebacillaceae bacterium]